MHLLLLLVYHEQNTVWMLSIQFAKCYAFVAILKYTLKVCIICMVTCEIIPWKKCNQVYNHIG